MYKMCPSVLYLVFYIFSLIHNISAITVDIKKHSEVIIKLENKPCTINSENCKTDVDDTLKGERGIRGVDGVVGAQGLKGVRGPKGGKGKYIIQGPIGLDGLKGRDFNFTCKDFPEDVETDLSKELVDITDEYSSIKESCCRGSPGSGGQILGKSGKLYCNASIKEICVKSNTARDFHKYEYKADESLWMSNFFDPVKIYDLTFTQIEWLQKISSSARQILRYHCKNAQDYNRDANKSLSLLMWNDVIIDSNNIAHPYYFTIPKNADGCFGPESSTGPNSTDIVLDVTLARRLPIKDILIRPTSKVEQEFYLENLELCFGCPVVMEQ